MRDPVFDIMKGIAIIAVIIGHIVIPIPLRDLIFTWHMPMFFIVSGFFYKRKSNLAMFKSNSNSLLLPYFATAVFLSITACFIELLRGDICSIKDFLPIVVGSGTHEQPVFGQYFVGAIWFLQAMFWCRTIFNIISFSRLGFVLGSIIAFIISLLLIKYIFIPTNILQGMNAMLYFAFGYWAKLKFGKVPIRKGIFFICLFVTILSSFYGPLGLVSCYYPSLMLNLLGAFTGTYLVYCISYKLNRTFLGTLLSKLGIISILILCIHIIDLNVLSIVLLRLVSLSNLSGIIRVMVIDLWHLIIPIVFSLLLYKKRLVQLIYFRNR